MEGIVLEKEKQIKVLHETRNREKQQYNHLEKRNQELQGEKEQFKNTISRLQQGSQARIKQLEQEVEHHQARIVALQKSNTRISNLCDKEINKDNVIYEAMKVEQSSNSSRTPRQRYDAERPMSRNHSMNQSYDSGDEGFRRPHSRSGRSSVSSVRSSYEEDPRYATSPRSRHDSRGSVHSSYDSESERYDPHHRPSSRSSVCSTQVQTHDVSKNSVETQSSSAFVRGSSLRSTAPARGVVAPQRRAPPPTEVKVAQPKHSFSLPFSRSSKARTPVKSSRPHSSAEVQPFSRNNPLRSTMPEKRTMHVRPERHSNPPSNRSQSPQPQSKGLWQQGIHLIFHPAGSNNRHSLSSSMDSHRSTPVHPEKQKMNSSSTRPSSDHPDLDKSGYQSGKDCGSDSGHATSPDSPEAGDSKAKNGYIENGYNKENSHKLTSIQVTSTETRKSQFRSSTSEKMPQVGEKWKYFIDKIVELQDKNQGLIVENSDLRRTSNSQKFSSSKLSNLEERNLELEIENRKLKKIVEMLQGSVRNPNDPREYQFYTNV